MFFSSSPVLLSSSTSMKVFSTFRSKRELPLLELGLRLTGFPCRVELPPFDTAPPAPHSFPLRKVAVASVNLRPTTKTGRGGKSSLCLFTCLFGHVWCGIRTLSTTILSNYVRGIDGRLTPQLRPGQANLEAPKRKVERNGAHRRYSIEGKNE